MRYLVVSAALCGGPLTAQDITVQAVTDISVFAKSATTTAFQTVKKGTAVVVAETDTRSQHIRVFNASVSTGTGYASLTQSANASYIDIINGKFVRALTASFSHNGTTRSDGIAATSASPTAAGATAGPNSFLVTIRHPKHVVGNLLVSWRAQHNAKSLSTAVVDVGNDGKVDFAVDSSKTTSTSTSLPADFSKGPLVIKVTVSGHGNAQGVGSYHNFYEKLTLNLVKQGSCRLATYGAVCGGARLDAGILKLGSTSILSMKMTNGVNSGFFARVVGAQRTNVTLPGNCPLLVSPDVIALLRADANGAYTEAFTMPADSNLLATFQYVPFDLVNGQLQAMTTNAWELSCSGF